jgi:hypothetical protein
LSGLHVTAAITCWLEAPSCVLAGIDGEDGSTNTPSEYPNSDVLRSASISTLFDSTVSTVQGKADVKSHTGMR